MSARKEISLKKIGIIAGGGVLPHHLLERLKEDGVECHVIGFKGYTDHVPPDFWARIGASGKTIVWLKEQGIENLILIGAIKRPGLFELWPDWVTFKFFLKAWINSFGDSSLLSAARAELEKEGFKLHGVHKFLPELLMPEGVLGQHIPQEGHQFDVQIGLKASQELGKQDVGQAVIVKDRKIVAREDRRGTSAMIRKHGCQGAILVKTCKPQQDRDLDLPTIGFETVRLCAGKGMAGIVGQAGQTLLVDREEAIRIANDNGLFMMGVTIDG